MSGEQDQPWSGGGPGVHTATPGLSAAAVAEAARARGMVAHTVGPVGSVADFMTVAAAALSFPSWFGRNLDALADSLADLDWLPTGPVALVWAEPDWVRSADPTRFAALIDTLRDAATQSATGPHPLTVILTDS